MSRETRHYKEFQLKDFSERLLENLSDQIYEKYNLTMENMQILVALPNENWRPELTKKSSPLFLLSPTTVQVSMQLCMVKNDPELPICKIKGNLDQIGINISDYRLMKLAQIMDTIAVSEFFALLLFLVSNFQLLLRSFLRSLAKVCSFKKFCF